MGTRQRLYPSPEQKQVLDTYCDHERFLFNLAIEQFEFAARYRPFRLGRRQSWPSQAERGRQLTELRATHGWLRVGSLKVQQQALRIVDRSFRNWWANPRHFRRPRFRSRYGTQGFSLVGAGADFRVIRLSRRWAAIKIPKLATPVRFRLSAGWHCITEARSCRITCDPSGRWHISFPGPQPELHRTSTGAVLGIDRGVTNTIATSDGTFDQIPGLSPGETRRWLRLERQLARQQKGSKRRERTRRSLARLRQRLGDRRRDWIEQTTTSLVRDHDLIAVENLQIRNMVRSARGTIEQPGRNVRAKSGLNRAIHAQCWGELQARLQQKAAATPPDHQTTIVTVPARNTSRSCRICDLTTSENRKSQAVFACIRCGHRGNADTEAAHNILTAAIQKLPVTQPPVDNGYQDVETSPQAVHEASTTPTATPAA